MTLSDLRRNYGRHGLIEAEAAADPITQLRTWLDQAIAAGVPDANAMVLATVGPNGQPSARVVLLRGLDLCGLSFFTNYLSRKGRELATNPRAAATFFWPEVERQVRAEGIVELLPEAVSDEYFASRPRDSQLGAWVSDQSNVVAGGRSDLESRLAELTAQFAGGPVPRPPHWGGYRLRPSAIEFWQGRPGRLHDRLLYSAEADSWKISRLAP